MSNYHIEDWNEDAEFRKDKQFAVSFDLEEDCYVEIWMKHYHMFIYDNIPTLAEKVVTETLRAGKSTLVVDIEDYINRHYDVCVIVYTCETGNTVIQAYNIDVDQLNNMKLVMEC